MVSPTRNSGPVHSQAMTPFPAVKLTIQRHLVSTVRVESYICHHPYAFMEYTGQNIIIIIIHLPPWIRSFDLFRHRRIAIVSWGVHGLFFLEVCSGGRASGVW